MVRYFQFNGLNRSLILLRCNNTTLYVYQYLVPAGKVLSRCPTYNITCTYVSHRHSEAHRPIYTHACCMARNINLAVGKINRALGLGDIGIYCHDISWQKVSRYYYISRYFIFSQPETNYIIKGIILVDTLIATHYMKYIFILLSSPL